MSLLRIIALALACQHAHAALAEFPCPIASCSGGTPEYAGTSLATAAACTDAGGTSSVEGTCTYPATDGTNSGQDSKNACSPSVINGVKTFHAMIDPHASETGHYVFAECVAADGSLTPHPTLKMEQNVNYVFDQSHVSNWMHPLGFAYHFDGAHSEGTGFADELELGITKYGTSCDDGDNPSCQAPYYYKQEAGANSLFQGGGGDPSSPTGGDFGLDAIEPLFYNSRENWGADKYAVHVKLATQDSYLDDLYYFCHIHSGMSGRIKILDSGTDTQNHPEDSIGDGHIPSDYYGEVSTFDESCGTFDLGSYENKCQDDVFVCDNGKATDGMKTFHKCLHAMDCHMQEEMRATLHESDPMITFMHQMIPHHQNAVNMAKAVLKLNPASIADEGVEDMIWAIINNQNHQIQLMQGWIEGKSYDPAKDECKNSASGMPSPLLLAAAASTSALFILTLFAM
jgi:hypothetical protein